MVLGMHRLLQAYDLALSATQLGRGYRVTDAPLGVPVKRVSKL